MALTVKQLHGASSFLLTFEPIDTSDVALSTQPFHILLDPCIVAADADLALSAIDVALISSPRRCHCHEPTLRRLPPRTRILAAPLAARRIRGWRHFHTVETLPRWDDSARGARRDEERDKILRIPVLSRILGGEPGEVTLTYIGPKRGSHVAIGITYRPPMVRRRTASPVPTPPLRLPTPAPSFSADDGGGSSSSSVTSGSPPLFLPATPPPPPPLTHTATPTSARSCGIQDSTVSVVFAPHGIAYTALQGYATAHLLQESALPLTALLYCFDNVSPPWYSYRHHTHRRRSALAGQETAAALGARAWIGARGSSGGGDKDGQRAVEVQRALDRCFADGGEASPDGSKRHLLTGSPGGGGGGGGHHYPTEVRALAVGEEIAMTSEGVWEEETLFSDEGKRSLELLGLGLDMGSEKGLLPVDWLGNAW
ncbi:uncharacterized protein BBA_00114 [Beauveria bassiana ARSEF 2860]|uniref:Uncharacterized protein n=1 Tax=Beauveria bassiana (strain ARSEF 2860) TaxID=655819 RepID=J4KR79_BEAB2|nr:uncharacterized protein BBA_00114 [Beauveria bassiana ARSEF 2860]EJP70484.1 hypothetical protein BBA_00114 [Beauveria bassiana ARSEF 2860]